MRYDLPRHMRLKHGWSASKAKSVNLMSKSKMKYQWKYGAPVRSKCVKVEKNEETNHNNGSTQSKVDYHKTRRCPILRCFHISKRVYQHLKNVHKIDSKSSEYKELLSQAEVVKWQDIPVAKNKGRSRSQGKRKDSS